MSYQRAKGHATSYDIVDLGYNFRMDDIRASIGVVQMQKLKKDLIERQKVRALYVDLLSAINQVVVPFSSNQEFVSNYIMPIVLKNSSVEKRDAVREFLHAKGIQTSNHYPAIHRFSVYKDYPANLPITEYVSDNEISLPMYAALTEDEIKYIVTTLHNSLRE